MGICLSDPLSSRFSEKCCLLNRLTATDWRSRSVFSPLYLCVRHTWIVHLLPHENLIRQPSSYSFWCRYVLRVFIPRTGGLLASRLAELPDEKRSLIQANHATHEILNRYGRDRFSAHWSPGEPLTRAARIADAQQAIYNEYRQQQLHQVKLVQTYPVSPRRRSIRSAVRRWSARYQTLRAVFQEGRSNIGVVSCSSLMRNTRSIPTSFSKMRIRRNYGRRNSLGYDPQI